MDTSRSKNARGSFDYSTPPPSFAAQSASNSYRFSDSPFGSPGYVSSLIKPEPDFRTSEHANVSDLRSSPYYEPHHQLQITRPSSRERSDSAFCSYPSPTPSVDSIMFGPPPPPPPAEPYPGNEFVLKSAVYTFQAPPPPPAMMPIGAGQYVTQQSGNFQPPQYQGEYGTGYSKRSGFNNHLNRKRNMPQEYEPEGPKKGSAKKKKKPLSQNMSSNKHWSVEDARRALEVEREYNKRHKSPSLIIKFPDRDLNRDIVSKLHEQIDSVHFQQPSTPRFCFVTLKDTACMDEVIKDLCKTKFGDGYLTAEPKNSKEEDLVKGPEDIDPLTLYVGNLAQEVTVEDVHKAYPEYKRVDIGFAKKMKYTRYAFVSFSTVKDAIKAFQDTRATDMYNKSLIVRFRRLHGTVGLPGDPKPQNSQKRNGTASNHTISAEHNKDLEKVPKSECPDDDDGQLIEGTVPMFHCLESSTKRKKSAIVDYEGHVGLGIDSGYYTLGYSSRTKEPVPTDTSSSPAKLEPSFQMCLETNTPAPVSETSKGKGHMPVVVKEEPWAEGEL